MAIESGVGGAVASHPESDDHLATIHVLTPLSIVVPTYKEVDSLPHLLERINALRARHDLELELLIMDDQSNDGSVELVEQSGYDWARIVVRDGPRGLSPAVLDGLRLARHPVVVVMDADLSHPPEKIPAMILALASGQQFVIGSRYVPGGSTDDEWGFFRWLNSQVATLLARPLTDARDPMAGFFAFRRDELKKAPYLNPIGYKIGLELIVKCGLENVGEVPIQFTDRRFGQSKLSFKEQLCATSSPRLGQMFWTRFDSGGLLELDLIDEFDLRDHGLEAEPFNDLQLFVALSISLKTIVMHANRLPLPLVFAVRTRTVANVDSIGLVVWMCRQCSAGKS